MAGTKPAFRVSCRAAGMGQRHPAAAALLGRLPTFRANLPVRQLQQRQLLRGEARVVAGRPPRQVAAAGAVRAWLNAAAAG